MSDKFTPKFSSSKVLVRYCLSVFTNNQYWSMRLVRGSDSTIFIGDENANATSQQRASYGSYMSSYVDGRSVTQEFLDSPSTTSATTYKVQIINVGGRTNYINRNHHNGDTNATPRTASSITLMEIAG